ncbi:hypothetical protein KKY_3308 [Pelagibacterium halotolerans B2]|uniref:Uncharacterized protein n=1 Tax=Pelagibacterium halotolerans (strain DSM 22347 / JCM 15775 / CGMCC 1.7692 / B2) TaxID=1082931 RepID=G4R7N5_PELHB|nr:hypothetical protein KKY_3308 [Pelagibacterium halotolerans B2]
MGADICDEPYTKPGAGAKAQSDWLFAVLAGVRWRRVKIWVAIVISVGHIGAHRGAAKGWSGIGVRA